MKNFICLFITLCFSLQSFSQMKYSLNSGENNALWYVKDYHKDDLSTKFLMRQNGYRPQCRVPFC